MPGGLVQHLPLELGEPHIPNGLREPMILEHATDVQILQDNDTWSFCIRLGFRHDGRGGLVKGVLADMSNTSMHLSQFALGTSAVLGTFLLAGMSP